MKDNNYVHPSVVIHGDVEFGENNQILPFTNLIGPLKIGNNNIIGPHVVIGSPGQDTKNPRHDTSHRFIRIGNNNIIREFSAIQKPCYREVTELTNDIYIMQGVHVPHDALIEDNAVITPMVAMGGITRILTCANLGIGCSLHQYTVIGQYSIIAMGAVVTKNVKPFSKYIPGKKLSVNYYSIEKFNLTEFKGEIEDYVLRDVTPKSQEIGAIVDYFVKHHEESKRDLFGNE